jgi:hypothetical protein
MLLASQPDAEISESFALADLAIENERLVNPQYSTKELEQ